MEDINSEFKDEIIKYNILKEHNINISPNDICLIIACKNNNLELIKWLLSFNYHIINDKLTHFLFCITCENNSLQVLDFLYDNNIYKNYFLDADLIFNICEEGYFELLLWLYSKTPLFFYSFSRKELYELLFISKNNIDIVKWLLDIYDYIPVYLNNDKLFIDSVNSKNIELCKLLSNYRPLAYLLNVFDNEIVHFDIKRNLCPKVIEKFNVDKENCIICYNSSNIYTFCNHYYCLTCLDAHIEKNNRNCPYCRRFLYDDDCILINH